MPQGVPKAPLVPGFHSGFQAGHVPRVHHRAKSPQAQELSGLLQLKAEIFPRKFLSALINSSSSRPAAAEDILLRAGNAAMATPPQESRPVRNGDFFFNFSLFFALFHEEANGL